MTKRPWLPSLLACSILGIIVIAGCDGSTHKAASKPTVSSTTVDPSVTAGNRLLPKIITAPVGFSEDQTSGATGAVTPSIFSQYGGTETAAKSGFVAGYKQNYIDDFSSDGIAITLFEFKDTSEASSYFSTTASQTLKFAAATVTPLRVIPGAISVAGTKEYSGEYAHGIVFAKGPYYVSVIYVNVDAGAPPGELTLWAKDQWLMLS
jgi:hypothetical protein